MQQQSPQPTTQTLDLSILKYEQSAKIQQFIIMVQFLRNQQIQIQAQIDVLRLSDVQFGNKWNIVKSQILGKDNASIWEQVYENSKQIVYSVLSHYNHKVRLPRSIQGLIKLQEKYHNKLLPPPSPCEYIDTNLWLTQSQKTNSQNWIGHGYYWKTGDNKTKDNYNGDYNTIQPGFHRIKSAKVLMVDYQLLQKDFPQLQNKSKQYMQEWLLEQTAYLSEGQIRRIQPGGDLYEQLQLGQKQVEERVIDFGAKKKTGIRYRGAGRAVNFIIDDKYKIVDGVFECQSINVKGAGSQKIIQGFGPKQNGLLSLVDAIKQYSYQKLIQKISQKENKKWQTVKTYAFIDIGLKYRKDLQSPATGYKGDRLGLTIRQASSRYQNSFDEVCYYSVIPEQKQNIDIIKDFRQTLMKYGISAQQQPLQILKTKEKLSVDNLSGSWNIQADATMTRFLDFSQFYVLPNSQLPKQWKMSENALLQGIYADKFAFKLLLSNRQLLLKYFGTDEIQQVNKKYIFGLVELEKKYGDTVGKMRKPKFSWSWFLETDDCDVQNFATKYGLNYEQVLLTPSFFEENYKKWLDF